jgi:hypothetical protein
MRTGQGVCRVLGLDAQALHDLAHPASMNVSTVHTIQVVTHVADHLSAVDVDERAWVSKGFEHGIFVVAEVRRHHFRQVIKLQTDEAYVNNTVGQCRDMTRHELTLSLKRGAPGECFRTNGPSSRNRRR